MNTRSGRLSQTQQETFVRYLESHPELARGRPRTSEGNQRTKVQWQELTRKLNAIEGGVFKSNKALAKYWADKKWALKKACAKQKRQFRVASNTSDEAQSLSDLDIRLIHLLNGKKSDCENPLMVPKQEEPDSDEVMSLTSEPSSPAARDEDELISSSSPPRLQRESNVQAEPLEYSKSGQKWPRRLDQPFLQTEWNRLADMEEKRLEAEYMAAKAQRDSSVAMSHCSKAIEALASAVRAQGAEVAEALRANGQIIADALETQGKVIAEALQRR